MVLMHDSEIVKATLGEAGEKILNPNGTPTGLCRHDVLRFAYDVCENMKLKCTNPFDVVA